MGHKKIIFTQKKNYISNIKVSSRRNSVRHKEILYVYINKNVIDTFHERFKALR